LRTSARQAPEHRVARPWDSGVFSCAPCHVSPHTSTRCHTDSLLTQSHPGAHPGPLVSGHGAVKLRPVRSISSPQRRGEFGATPRPRSMTPPVDPIPSLSAASRSATCWSEAIGNETIHRCGVRPSFVGPSFIGPSFIGPSFVGQFPEFDDFVVRAGGQPPSVG